MRKIWKVRYVYLEKQFEHPRPYFAKIARVVTRGDFTLGKELTKFEEKCAKILGVKYTIGVASGTDALYLPLRALGIKAGDEVITTPNTFVAAAAAIALTGARPVFVDVRDDYTIDPTLIERAITAKTRGIIPVHLTGNSADLYPILKIAKKHKLFVVEDAAQAFLTLYDKKPVGSFGLAGAFSFHPLKILHVWGDGGMITTNDARLADNLRLWRNHGLRSRNEVEFFAHNSRLHTLQAAVALTLLPHVPNIIEKRRKNADLYKKLLAFLEPMVHIPNNMCAAPTRSIYANFVIQVQRREGLIKYLNKRGIEVVIQYPIPLHLQKAAAYLGYKKGDFPVAEKQADTILTLPNHQHLKTSEVRYVCESIIEFYSKFKK